MAKQFHGFGYLAALVFATAGFMFGSTTLFTVVLWALAWVPVAFWLLSPVLLLMAVLELVIFTMTMDLIRSGEFGRNWTPLVALHILWTSTALSLRITELTFIIITGYVREVIKAKRRASLSDGPVVYRVSMKPLREQVNRGFREMCH